MGHRKTEKIDWQDVYDHSLPKIFHYFCYKVGDTALAEELTAITFEKSWKSRTNFRKDAGQFQAWMMGIARNVAADHFRKERYEVPLEDMAEWGLSTTLEEDAQRDLDFQNILEILSRFPQREQELIALKYGAELTNREIARISGLSESNVGTILYRVVLKIRKEWEEDHAGGPVFI